MGRNAREHMCNTFSSAKLAEKTIAVYDEIANPRLAT
jgi:hypothetical protein